MSKHLRDWSPDAPSERETAPTPAKRQPHRRLPLSTGARRRSDRLAAMQREMETAR